MASGNANKRSGDHQGSAGGAKKLKKTQVDFSVADSNLTDVVLVVEGQRFHVLKGRLAYDSRPFYTMFFETHRDQPEIELTGFGAEEFQSFLEIVHGYATCGNGEVARKVLEIADKYDVDLVRKKCEKKMIETARFTKKEKMEIALKFGLDTLKSVLLKEIKTFGDLEAVLPSDIADLDPATMKAVLEKSLEFNRAAPVLADPEPAAPAQPVPRRVAPVPVPRALDPDDIIAQIMRRPRRQAAQRAHRAQNRAPQ
ncbi:hypothetical protein GCK72_007565 [Caenorhabditis remanei]|uniref:BTB domain-containing protein n=1 Tax=Caenorhabditis remanei TaxID=31234 RepID=A0A6A5HLQ4_CAERE|nr:hypothetical protein GCK72_007565 [Caenorhabditis remanei]KAF1767606.1 hypothetical protein GCK72_007565 [Caenorhabditis remanei]